MTIKLYLDTRGHLPAEESPIKICVNHRSKTAFIGTGRKVVQSQWDAKLQKVVGHPRAEQINHHLQHRLLDVMDIAERLQDAGLFRAKIATEIKDLILAELEPAPVEKPVGTFYNAFVDFRSTKTNKHTRERYDTTYNKIAAFDPNFEKLTFEDITYNWLVRFDKHLSLKAPAKNARAVDLRNIRSVFNYAINDERTEVYPFRRYKIEHAETIKRNLRIADLRKLFDYTPKTKARARLVNLARLMFVLTGMYPVDIYNLDEFVNGRVVFKRAKTGRVVDFPVLPEMLPYIEACKGEKRVFFPSDVYKDSDVLTTAFDRAMKDVAEDLKIRRFSALSIRHTWGTIAASLDVPKETIGACLGNGKKTVTDTYINFDNKKVDEACKKVLAYFFRGEK